MEKILSLGTEFLRSQRNRIMEKIVKEKLGVEVNVDLNRLNIYRNDGKVYCSFDGSVSVSEENLSEIISNVIN